MRVQRRSLRSTATAAPAPPARAAPTPAGAHAPRLRPAVVETALAAAALLARSDGPEGREPLLGPYQATRVREVWARATPTVRMQLEAMLDRLDGAAAPVARALLLRAVAARARSLVDGERAPEALAVLTRFVGRLHGRGERELRRRATVLDLDSRVNTSAFDPQQLWQTQGTVRDGRQADGHADNDGLFQRFTGACGAATLQMMLAEADPVMAFALHDVGVTSDATDDSIADFQRAVLDEYGGGKALGRVESYLRSRIHNALGRLERDGSLDARARDALCASLFRGAPLGGEAKRALEVLRARWGFPSDQEIARLRAVELPRADDGIGVDALVELVNVRHGDAIGARYTGHVFARGHAWRHIDAAAEALRRGLDVPFGSSEPPHWMLLTAVRGRKPHRHFLVSDPDGGRTVWVHERSFVRGTFLDEQLHLPRPGDRPYVDCVLLPERS
ncbi:MAG: hypothetical protein HYS27_07070 [Deltaproteobacteria bacterium]|nr:hypothetical protein [Deltaproteobacteria bacterium]